MYDIIISLLSSYDENRKTRSSLLEQNHLICKLMFNLLLLNVLGGKTVH
jgi:hypothetical protein